MGCIISYPASNLEYYNGQLQLSNLSQLMINSRYNPCLSYKCAECCQTFNRSRIQLLMQISMERYYMDVQYLNKCQQNVIAYLSSIINNNIPADIIKIILEYNRDNYGIHIEYIKSQNMYIPGYRIFVYDSDFNRWDAVYLSCIQTGELLQEIYHKSSEFRYSLRKDNMTTKVNIDIVYGSLIRLHQLDYKKPRWFLTL